MWSFMAHVFAKKHPPQENERISSPEPKPQYVKMVRQVGLKVLDFSSQYGSNDSASYAASNLAGTGYSYPNYGDFIQSFVLRTYGIWWRNVPSCPLKFKRISKVAKSFQSTDFVDVLFEQLVYPKTIHVLETYNPGAVVRILALVTDEQQNELMFKGRGRWVTLWSGNTQNCPAAARSFSPPLETIEKPTRLIRLEFNQDHLDYYTELDAVELMGNAVQNDSEPPQTLNDVSANSRTDLTTLLKQLSISDDATPFTGNRASKTCSCNGFFDILPTEVIHLIFMYLKFEDLMRVAVTCRLFLRHCYDPVWYKELDLQPCWDAISDVSLKGLQARCAHTEKLNLSWCGPYNAITTSGFAQFLGGGCAQLVCLRLSACTFIDDIALRTLSQSCPRLEELDVSCCMNATDAGFAELGELKHFRRLNFYRDNISAETLLDVISSSSGLEHFNIGACALVDNCDDVADFLSKTCRNLVSLDFWRKTSLTSEGIERLADGCPFLEELDIGWCTSVACSTDCIRRFAKSHPKLKKLFLTAIRSTDSQDVLAVADYCPDMEQLDILGTSLVEPAAIQRVIAKCTKLKFLDLSFCSKLKKHFIQELRTMYPNIAFKKSVTHEEH